jgi:hypothetical protein
VRIRLAIPDRLLTPAALEAALEATTLANAEAIRRGEVPHIEDAIRRGVRWRPEPFVDGEHFDLAHQVMRRNWGDCDDLAPWLSASLREQGEDARTRVVKTGRDRWHAVTELSDGRILDPSKWAGMGKRSANVSGVGAALARPFARRHGGALCVMPDRSGRWWSRVDLPWSDGRGHLASHARASTPYEALYNAVAGAVVCGEEIDSPLVDRARAAAEMLLSDVDELVDDDGEVGSFFGSILKAATNPMSLLNPIAHKAGLPNIDPLSAMKGPAGTAAANVLVPGLGTKLHDQGVSMLDHLSHGGGSSHAPGAMLDPRGSGAVSVPLESAQEQLPHQQHMMLYYHPKGDPGPVVMRF